MDRKERISYSRNVTFEENQRGPKIIILEFPF
jgi:hypothetical protein